MCVNGSEQPLWQRLNAIGLLLLILTKFVFGMSAWRFVFEGMGAVCVLAAVWMMFAERSRRRVR
jgi:hypothetical protein